MLQIAAFPFWVYATLLMIPIIILCFCCWRFIGRRRRERDHYERRVLVVCPYCGHKNEQGMSKCGECGADL
ncbi:MAG: zinc ribbon domain-containing protein [Candidatus Thorarchaeota archaeon]